MGYEYLDEQTSIPCNLSKDELKQKIEEMQIEKYGHIITVDMAHKEPRKTIYSVKKNALGSKVKKNIKTKKTKVAF